MRNTLGIILCIGLLVGIRQYVRETHHHWTASVSTESRMGPRQAKASDALSRPNPSTQRRILGRYGNLPLAFEKNEGQSDAPAKFLAHGPGYALFLNADEAVLSLDPGTGERNFSNANTKARQGDKVQFSRRQDSEQAANGMTLRMRLIGANTEARIQGLDELSGKTNYLIGNDPREWHTNIPNYVRVECTDVYPGVDLVYYGSHHELEYDFVVAPHSDPSPIRFAIGVLPTSAHAYQAAHLDISTDGDLIVHTRTGEVRFHRPVAYQDSRSGKKRAVEANYALDRTHGIKLRIAPYDREKPLIIDPMLSYSTYLGPSGGIYAIAVDSSGNAYVTGGNNRTGFPTTPGAFETTCIGGCSSYGASFVSEFNSTASALVYSTYLGGTLGITFGNSIAVDSAGDAYVTGETGASDFPTTAGAFQTACNTCAGATETAFVTELDPSGSALVYSTFLGGPGSSGAGIAVDSSDNAYVAGSTSSTNFPVTSGSYQSQNNGQTNAFVTKLNSSGSALIYSTYLGGTNDDSATAIALNSAGNAYILGNSASNDGFPTTPGAYQSCPKCGNVLFLTELSTDAATLVYSTLLGGVTEANIPGGIAIDSSGNAYVTGITYASDFPTTAGAFQAACPAGDCGPVNGGRGNGIGFLTKLNPSGTDASYSTYLGGTGYSAALGVVVDAAGNAYVGGYTESLNFPVTPDAFQSACTNCTTNEGDAFLAELNNSGSSLLYATYLGGSQKVQEDAAHGIAMDSNGNVYLAGQALSTNFPTTPGVFQPTASSSTIGAFVAKFAFGSTGTGADFSFSAATGGNCPSGGNCSTSATVTAGQTATYDLQVSPVSGFNGTVTLGCTDALAKSTCAVSPTSVTVNGTTATAFTVTVTTTASSTLGPLSKRTIWKTPLEPLLNFRVLFALALLLLGSMVVAAYNPRRRVVPVFAALILSLVWITSCGGGGSNGGGSSGTPSGTVTITGSSSGVNHSASLNLTVN